MKNQWRAFEVRQPTPDIRVEAARSAWDAASALGLAQDVIADWRRRLAMEPTITNARAAEPGGEEVS